MGRKKCILYFEFNGAYCGLTTDSRREILRRLGADNVATIRFATQDDVTSVKAMGGFVPDGCLVEAETCP